MPNENGHWPLVFMINWGLYFEGVEGFTCFQIDWNKSNKGISFDMQWTKVVNDLNGEYIVSDVLHFCQFDFKLPSQRKKWDNPIPQIMNKSPIPTTDFPSPFTNG